MDRSPQAIEVIFSDDYIKSNPARLGGSLTSKPTSWNAFGCSATSVFIGFWR
jgi:hypothetical protein